MAEQDLPLRPPMLPPHPHPTPTHAHAHARMRPQNNISALDKEDQIKCLTGVVEAKVLNTVAQGKPKNFDEWIMRVMGPVSGSCGSWGR
jgi:hypothetical protein